MIKLLRKLTSLIVSSSLFFVFSIPFIKTVAAKQSLSKINDITPLLLKHAKEINGLSTSNSLLAYHGSHSSHVSHSSHYSGYSSHSSHVSHSSHYSGYKSPPHNLYTTYDQYSGYESGNSDNHPHTTSNKKQDIREEKQETREVKIEKPHVSTDKHKDFIPYFRKITDKYGDCIDFDLGIDGRTNPNPEEYYIWILEKLAYIDKMADGDCAKFREIYKNKIVNVLRDNPQIWQKK